MRPMTARFLKEWICDTKEQACLWCFFIHQSRVLSIMDCEIRSKVPCPRNLGNVLMGLGYREASMKKVSYRSDHVTQPPYCVTCPCRGQSKDENRLT